MNAFSLNDGSRVAVIGGGPAGSFFSYFLLEIADKIDLNLEVDVYEPKDFCAVGPKGCNNCGGIVSESLVQMLATEGINLPPGVVQRGIDSYVLHSDVGRVKIDGSLDEKRIAAVHRGNGPRGAPNETWGSFDRFLLDLAAQKGANVVQARIEDITWEQDRPTLHVRGGSPTPYDLIVGAVGANAPVHRCFQGLGFSYRPPKTAKTYIAEFRVGRDEVDRCLGNSMHVFLLPSARVDFAAMIPKGDYVTFCMLGHDIDKQLVDEFLERPEVRESLPPGWRDAPPSCHCSPRINVGSAKRPFADRIALIGDSAVTRLYKDGIGAAYRTAKACALTAALHGVSAADFRKHYWPTCRRLEIDNELGTAVFGIVGLLRRLRFGRRSVVKLVRREQTKDSSRRIMSGLLWDTFTGSASYKSILKRGMKPTFLARWLGVGTTALVLPYRERPAGS